jgi:hypothetical protein
VRDRRLQRREAAGSALVTAEQAGYGTRLPLFAETYTYDRPPIAPFAMMQGRASGSPGGSGSSNTMDRSGSMRPDGDDSQMVERVGYEAYGRGTHQAPIGDQQGASVVMNNLAGRRIIRRIEGAIGSKHGQ